MTEGVAPMLEAAVREQLVPEATSAASLWLVMMKAYRSMQTYVEHTLVDMGMGLSDFMILEVLLHKGPLSMSEIGGKVLLANPSITAAIGRLERLGYVTRQHGTEDRRVRTVDLTREGRRIIRKIYAQHEVDLETVMQGVCAEQRARTREVLKNIGIAAKAMTSCD